jgi:hypothetical protein
MDTLHSYPIWLSAYSLGNTLTPQDVILSPNLAPVDRAKDNRILSVILQNDPLCEKWIGDM